DYRERSRQVDRVGSFEATEMNMLPDAGDPRRGPGLGGAPELLRLSGATPDLMQLVGVTALAGRVFAVEEDRAGGPAIAMISDRLWAELFGRAPSAIGASIRMNGVRRTIVGVVSSSADFGVMQILSA